MSQFRTIEISNPDFEDSQIRFVTLKSRHLNGRGDICIYVPTESELNKTPVAILLHGVYGSSWVWALKGGACKTINRLISENKIKPMILVMPSDGLWGDGSGYLPHSNRDFEKWICEDVIEAVKKVIPEAHATKKSCLAGLSMGGYGALMIGAKYPEKFCAISAHSSMTSVSHMSLFVEEPLSTFRQPQKMDEEVFDIMKKNRSRLVPTRFDCGREDLLLPANQKLHEQLSSEGIPHIFNEFEGKHEWKYWEEHLADTLLFFDKHLSK